MKKRKITKEEKEALLTLYLFAIEEINRLDCMDAIDDFLADVDLCNGVCWAINRFLDLEAGDWDARWIKKYIPPNNNNYWGPTPMFNNSKEDAIAALQIRVDNLKKELKYV